MEITYNYTCPHCSGACSVEESLTGQTLVCPHCSQEFFATPPEPSTEVILPERLPFFKSGRRKLLESKMNELVADGEMSDTDEQVLSEMAKQLGLDEKQSSGVVISAFRREFDVIQRRVEKAFELTDEDLQQIEQLKIKYGIRDLRLEGNASVFRRIYLLENGREQPIPISSDLLLDTSEVAYHVLPTTWKQMRVQRRGVFRNLCEHSKRHQGCALPIWWIYADSN